MLAFAITSVLAVALGLAYILSSIEFGTSELVVFLALVGVLFSSGWAWGTYFTSRRSDGAEHAKEASDDSK